MNAPTALESSDQKTRGDIYEGIAFNFCKIATVLLLLEILRLGRWALPITAGLAAVLFLLAHLYGTRTSRCILKKPLLIAAFWAVVVIAWLWWHRAFA
jgi:hypothetical protein